MKYFFFGLLLWVGLPLGAAACDICGCGVGSYYIGILPDFRKRFAGFRYQSKRMTTHLNTDGTRSYLTSEERYQTWELWSGWNIGRKFRVLGFVPLNVNERVNPSGTSRKSGIGDVALIGYYNLLRSDRTTDSSNRRVLHSLWIGGGVKLPTGRYDPADKSAATAGQNTFQLGTGSTDFLLNAMYDLRVQDAGLNLNAGYKINTANRYGYQYGNKLTVNALAYYKVRVAKVASVAPDTGVLYERAGSDYKDRSTLVEESGGHTLMGTVGAEIAVKRFGVGISYQTPLSQALSFGMIHAGDRVLANITIAF